MSRTNISNNYHIIFHFSSILLFVYSFYYSYRYLKIPDDLPLEFEFIKTHLEAFGGVFKYFTIQNLTFQVIYYFVALLNDFFGTNEHFPAKTPFIRRLRDYILATFAIPVAINVTSGFWTIYAIDRELIFPRFFDAFYPTWLNHVFHTFPAVFILLELFISHHQYPARRNAMIGLVIYLTGYAAMCYVVFFVSNLWVYPFLEAFSSSIRFLFFVGNIYYSTLFYRLGEVTNDWIWAKELEIDQGKNKGELTKLLKGTTLSDREFEPVVQTMKRDHIRTEIETEDPDPDEEKLKTENEN